jgi:hypothetical protein
MTLLSMRKRSIEESSPAIAQCDTLLERSVESLPDSSARARAARHLTALISDPQSVEPSSSIESEPCVFDESADRLEARINEKTQDTLAVPALSEAQPADSGNWLADLLARASAGARLEEIATEALAWPPDRFSPPMVADISRAWEETVAEEVEGTELQVDPAEASPNPAQESDIAKALEEALSGVLEAASGDIEQAPSVAPVEVLPDPTPELDITKMLEAFISRELENAFSRGLEGVGSGNMQSA